MTNIRIAIITPQNLVEMMDYWDGISVWEIPVNRRALVLPDNSPVESGWLYVATTNSFRQLGPTITEDGTEIIRMEKIDFMRLFTLTEQVRYNILKRQVAALETADYTAAMTGDMAKLALVQAEVLLGRFELVEEIELTHAETQQGIMLLGMIGIFGTVGQDGVTQEDIDARVAQVLGGHLPGVIPSE